VGWIGQDAGARWALVVGGLPTVLCGILALPALARIDRRRTGGKTDETDETPPAEPDSPDRYVPITATTGEPLVPGRS
jgi:hypothetical protein